MNSEYRTILAVTAGCIVGMIVNSSIIMVGPSLVGIPEGVDPQDMESIKENIHLYTPVQMMVPILAHALGTLVAGFLAAKIATDHYKIVIFNAGGFFFLGGMMAMSMIGGPLWFNALDLIVAYFPMAFLGTKLAGK